MVLTGLLAAALALIHVAAERLRFLDEIPRSRWLSMAGGVSVAYVFLHLFPDVEEAQRRISEAELLREERMAYLVALAGLVVFYGLERAAKVSRASRREESTSPQVFWLHMVSYSVYNALIGYLLVHREESGTFNLILYASAMGLHFLVNDYGLREHHRADYARVGRWVLAGAVLLGWGLGLATRIPEAALALLFAFLAGGIVLNVLKEELPDERESRFWAFALGAAAYALLLLAL